MDILGVAFRAGAAIAGAIMSAVRDGDTTTLQQLRDAVKSPEALAALDEALIHAERAKAEKALSG